MKKNPVYSRSINLLTETHPYTIRRSRKARHILLHVDTATGIELVVPWRVSVHEAESFLKTKRSWIERVLQRHRKMRPVQPARQLVTGEQYPLFEHRYTLQVETKKRSTNEQNENKMLLRIHAQSTQEIKAKIEKWYRQQARHYFTNTSLAISAEINVHPKKISIRNQKTQWGSCSARNTLSFNWRLLLGPERVARYVAVHEVVHLLHRNHSTRFWKAVEKLHPSFQEDRAWLRKNAHQLAW